MHPPPPLDVLEVLTSSPDSPDAWEYLVKRVRRPEQVELIRKNLLVSLGSTKNEKGGFRRKEQDRDIEKLERELKELKATTEALETDLQEMRQNSFTRAEAARKKEKSLCNSRIISVIRRTHNSRVRENTRLIHSSIEELENINDEHLPKIKPRDSNEEPRYVIKETGVGEIQTEKEALVDHAIDELVRIASQPWPSSSKAELTVEKVATTCRISEVLNAIQKDAFENNSDVTRGQRKGLCSAFHTRRRIIRKLRNHVLSSTFSLEKLIRNMHESEKALSSKLQGAKCNISLSRLSEVLLIGENAALEFAKEEKDRLRLEKSDASLTAKVRILQRKDEDVLVLDEKIVYHRTLIEKVVKENQNICNSMRASEVEFVSFLKEDLPRRISQTMQVLTDRIRFEQAVEAKIFNTDPEVDARIDVLSKRLEVARLRVQPQSSPSHSSSFLAGSSRGLTNDFLLRSCINACIRGLVLRHFETAQRKQLQNNRRQWDALKIRSERAIDESLQARGALTKVWQKPLELELENLRHCIDKDVASIEEDIHTWWTQPVRQALQHRLVDGRSLAWYENRFRKLQLRD